MGLEASNTKCSNAIIHLSSTSKAPEDIEDNIVKKPSQLLYMFLFHQLKCCFLIQIDVLLSPC